MFKRSVLLVMIFALSFSFFNPFMREANAKSKLTIVNEESNLSKNEIISKIEPYVYLKKDGTIGLKDVPKEYYDTYNIKELEKHLATINKGVRDNILTVDENLNIIQSGFAPFAVYGSWSYHWWGYDRNFTNSQAIDYRNDLLSAAAGATLVIGVGSAFPPVAGIATMSAGYWALLATRIDANNQGNGVYVAVTWALVFDVEPL